MLLKLLHGAFGRREPTPQERLALARRLQSRKRLSEAVEQYEALIELGDDTPLVHSSLANCLSMLGRAPEALPHYRRVAELAQHERHAESSVLGVLNYDPEATPDSVFEAHRAWGERLTASIEAPLEPPAHRHERIRVGYVSPDFRRHPVTYLFAPVLEHHDRKRFEIYCYDNLNKPDAVTARLQRASDRWVSIAGRPDESVADMVRQSGIDVLVDLAGHTTHSRLRAFAFRPAPVQVSWLGYFNTTGLSAMDYFITDPHSSPEGQDRCFVETLVRLPHTRFPYEPPDFAPAVAPLPALRDKCVTFGCFNNLSKVNERVIALWARVLDAVPKSRLKLIAVGLHDARNRDWWRARFAAHGITRARLELHAFLPHDQLLAAYGAVDVALDPFPFAGGLTSLEALYMGVPVVTLETPMLAGRQTLSFLRNVGLDALVAHSEDDYVEASCRLARDLDALAALRAGLRDRMRSSPLMDAAGFTRELEGAYDRMVRQSRPR